MKQKKKQLPTKAQVLEEIRKDFSKPNNFARSLSNIKTNKLEEDLFWEEYQKMRGEDES